MKKIKVIFYNVTAVLLIFFLTEFLIRLSFPSIQLPKTSKNLIEDSKYGSTHGLEPLSMGSSMGIIKKVDKEGFWKYTTTKSDNTQNILLLGDSATMGIGVEDDSTFGGIINNSIDSLKVYNPSLIGYTSRDYLNVVSYLTDSTKNKFDFKEIVVCWCLNDVYPNHPVVGFPGYDREESFSSKFISLLRNHLKLYHFLKKNFSDRPKQYFLFDEKFYSEENKQLNEAINHLESIKRICDKYSIKLKVALLPYEFQLRNYNSEKNWNPQNILKQKLARANVEIVDCKEAFDNFTGKSEDLYLYGDGIHFSKLGHKILAEFLADNI